MQDTKKTEVRKRHSKEDSLVCNWKDHLSKNGLNLIDLKGEKK